jgi:hypothetical protein
MKLTEAQLKAIVAEEVQAAIEEGLFGAVGGAIKGAAGALGGAAKTVGSAVGKAAGDVRAAAASGAAKANLESAVSTARTLSSKYESTFKTLGSSEESKQIALGVIETLARAAGIDLSDYGGMVKSQKTPEQSMKAFSGGDRGMIQPTAGGSGGRGGAYSASGSPVGTAESLNRSASRIAESIVRRITKESKRRR